MRKTIVSFLYKTISRLGLPDLIGNIPGRRVVILNLHRVNPYADSYAEALHPDLFDELLSFIKKHFLITTFSELTLGDDLQKRTKLILSFDDGYFDYVEYALPIMKKHAVHSNMNLIGQSLISGAPPFVGRLSAMFRGLSRRQLLELKIFGFPGEFSEKAGAFLYRNQVSNYLKSRSIESRDEIILKSSDWFSHALENCEFTASDRMIVKSELEGLKGHEIGSHSFSHESMGFQEDTFFFKDFKESNALFVKLGLPHQIYAFPNGSFKETQINYLHENGISQVLLTKAHRISSNSYQDSSPWQRYGFHAKSLHEARTKIFRSKLIQ
jgi:peptidoglycan/xylan/chitin deacetylase (PgdA/CDA1 family)